MSLPRLLLISLTLGCLFLWTACSLAAAPLEGTQPAHWRVIWRENPHEQATIAWSTAIEGQHHRVEIREEGGEEPQVIDCQRNGRYAKRMFSSTLFYHHARVKDLKPATKYFVTLKSDEASSREMYFITAPADDRPFRLLFGGDSRSGREARQKMNAMLADMVRERPDILALVHGGDYIADGGNLTQWSQWLSDHEITTGADGRLLPIVAARGNHDRGPLFNQVFDFSPGEANYYRTDIGQELTLLTLNTEISAGGPQREWLAEQLADARPTKRWLVTQYHRPAFPAVKKPSSALTFWVPLFEEFDVDLACEADGHVIKRTAPIRDGKIDPTGVVYIGEGGLGVGQRTPKADRWYLQGDAKCGAGHHVQLLSFTPEQLEYRAILLGGETFDRHVLLPRAKANLERRQ